MTIKKINKNSNNSLNQLGIMTEKVNYGIGGSEGIRNRGRKPRA